MAVDNIEISMGSFHTQECPHSDFSFLSITITFPMLVMAIHDV